MTSNELVSKARDKWEEALRNMRAELDKPHPDWEKLDKLADNSLDALCRFIEILKGQKKSQP